MNCNQRISCHAEREVPTDFLPFRDGLDETP